MPYMSFYHTTTAMRQRTKTHTIRIGWRHLKVGDQFTAVVKSRNVPAHEIEVLAQCRVLSRARRPLQSITQDEVTAEGFPTWTPQQFTEWYTLKMKCQPSLVVTFLSFEYQEPTQ